MQRLALAAGHSADFAETYPRERMGSEATENSRPRHRTKVFFSQMVGLAAHCLRNYIDKVQVYPTTKNTKEVQAFVRIWGFGGFFFPT